MNPDTWINLASVLLMGLAIIGTGFWRLSVTAGAIKDDIGALKDEVATQRNELETLIGDRVGKVYREMETDRRLTADSFAAVRQAVANLEIKSLENFVRRDSFHKFLDSMSEARQAFESDIRDRLKELQAKIDRLVERDNQRPT